MFCKYLEEFIYILGYLIFWSRRSKQIHRVYLGSKWRMFHRKILIYWHVQKFYFFPILFERVNTWKICIKRLNKNGVTNIWGNARYLLIYPQGLLISTVCSWEVQVVILFKAFVTSVEVVFYLLTERFSVECRHGNLGEYQGSQCQSMMTLHWNKRMRTRRRYLWSGP